MYGAERGRFVQSGELVPYIHIYRCACCTCHLVEHASGHSVARAMRVFPHKSVPQRPQRLYLLISLSGSSSVMLIIYDLRQVLPREGEAH
jgi:hypothetical protein